MPKVKFKRQNVTMDMTAMCDVAFLLLTFFILTTKFRPNEPVQVEIPASTAQIPLPAKDILQISVGNDGRVFFGVDDQNTRAAILDEVSKRYGFQVTGEMQKRFKLLDQFGVPLDKLASLLSLSAEEMGAYKQPGLPVDPKAGGVPGVPAFPDDSKDPNVKNHLAELIVIARQLNNELRIAVKADKGTDYKNIDDVIETLRKTNSNRFNLITSAKGSVE
jgi:biopolymer transport protein ExbD